MKGTGIARVQTTAVGYGRLNASLEKLKKTAVFVGIADGRKGDKREGEPIRNSELGYIHEFGSPAANIPARPFLRPGVKSAQERISDHLETAMHAALKDNAHQMMNALNAAGMEAVSGVNRFLSDENNGLEPLAPATLRNRHRARLTKSRRANEVENENVRPLINSGALKASIDFYVETSK